MKTLFFNIGICLSTLLIITSCRGPVQLIPNENQLISKIDEYQKERNALLRQDSLQYASSSIILSKKEQLLNQKIIEVQKAQLEKYKAEHFFPPARNFYQSKEHIEENPLFKWIQMMPKGGALHLHTLALGDVDWVIKKAMKTEEMYVYWNDDYNETKGALRAYKPEDVPGGYLSAKAVFSDPINYDEMRSLLTFDESIDRDSVDIWGSFEKIFNRVRGFVRYDPIMPEYLLNSFEILIKDNIQHAELRMPFEYNMYSIDDKAYDVQRLVDHFEYALKKARDLDPDFTVKVINANLRFRPKKFIGENIKTQFEYRQKYPKWLVGYDLVAEEDAGHPSLFHVDEFLMLDSLNTTTSTPLPLYLHNGESNWMNVTNLYDSYLLGAKRIGHGFNLFRFPGLLRKVKEEDICIEINPLSNQILGYIRDLRLHPGSTYLRNGLAVTISSDDPFIFDYHGLSYDYWSVFMAWELDLRDLKMLALNGLKYSALEGLEKERALEVWEQRWKEFIVSSLETFEF